MLEKKHLQLLVPLSIFCGLGNLTDLCRTWTWFLMISGNPSSKRHQRVWFQIRPTFDTSICTELKGLFLMGYATACSSSHARVQQFLSRKLQNCKVLGGGAIIFQVIHLLNSMETYITCSVQGDEVRTPCLHSDPHMLLL